MKRLVNTLQIIALTTILTACNNIQTAGNNKAAKENYSVQFVGTATVLIKYGDLNILTDPVFDAAGSDYDMGFTTLKKTGTPAILASELPAIDVVLVSHDQHQDNFDTLGREITTKAKVALSTTEAAKRIGNNFVGLAWWKNYQIGDVKITAVPAQHGPAQAVKLLGTVNGFIISSPSGPTIYISGDTVSFEGTDEIVKQYTGKIDYALLHTGQVAKEKNKPPFFTMSANEAIGLATKLNVAKLSIIHADGWAHFKETLPEALSIVKSSALSDRLVTLTPSQPVNIAF